MTSIPQLRADINDLQAKLAKAQERIAELENAPPKIVTKTEVVEVVKVDKVYIKVPVDNPTIKYIDREVVKKEYVQDPALLDTIRMLQARLRGE